MKNVSLILSIVSLIAAVTFGTLFLTQNSKPSSADGGESTEITANAGDIVYVNLDQIIMGYDYASDLRATVEVKVQKIQEEVQRRGKKFEKNLLQWQGRRTIYERSECIGRGGNCL